jgi:isocitrate dehydrogenase (NAD+)
MKRTKLGLKAATITPEGKGDVGSPNAILRRAIDGKVIVRTGRRIPACGRWRGSTRRSRSCAWPSATPTAPRSGARARRRRSRLRTERIERSVCRVVSEYAFFHARRTGAKVFGGPKYTVSPIYEGMLKEEMDAAAAAIPT